jgi:hypothetical protein
MSADCFNDNSKTVLSYIIQIAPCSQNYDCQTHLSLSTLTHILRIILLSLKEAFHDLPNPMFVPHFFAFITGSFFRGAVIVAPLR